MYRPPVQFLINLHCQTHRIGEKTKEDALGRASGLAEERRTCVTLAVEAGEGRERRAVNIAAVGRDGKIRFFPAWDGLGREGETPPESGM